ncbi:MAG: hypothetical protein Q8922_01940 [Bacteroidota bacterium]|nr:hypothetical protein [Bacteroidota bacterium]MDP4232011.1 hypothetical protein [Bacteroidota bacterium]MDP4241282.1 hypothetical protein [Bacteroidota bacterium]MDP4286674.1 hypothetical protein [Bacteroidota bacterium]
MRHFHSTNIAFIGFLISSAAASQTISVSPIARLAYCTGDTVRVAYTATGPFNTGNHFYAELSDSSGSFGSFTSSAAQSSAMSGTLSIPVTGPGTHYRVRVAASAPYAISPDNGVNITASTLKFGGTFCDAPHRLQVYASSYPGGAQSIPVTLGFTGQSITIDGGYSNDPGLTYSWQFESDATVDTSFQYAPRVVHSTSGLKRATLVNSNASGCSIVWPFWYVVVDCRPTIPRNAHVVTGTESGSDSILWIQAGGNYEINTLSHHALVFVEPGGVLTALGGYGQCYIKAGGSVVRSQTPQGLTGLTAIITPGVTLTRANTNIFDTFYCPTLDFDYSLAGVDDPHVNPGLTMHQVGDRLLVNADAESIAVRVANVLGGEVLAMEGERELDLDLSSLPAGLYIAVAQAGRERQVGRVLITH